MNELSELAFKYGSDKCPQIKHHFTDFYYNEFKDRKNEVKKVLEIGIGNMGLGIIGASLFMWRDFFPNAKIYGIDIDTSVLFEDDRIETFICNQTNVGGLYTLFKWIGTDLDLVVDDGSHKIEDQLITCTTIVPLLRKNAVYVIEDVNPKIVNGLEKFKCEVIKYGGRYRDDCLVVVRNA